MKFTDGYWMVREGMHPRHPAQGYDIWADDTAMTVYAPTTPIRARGDTLNRPVVTLTYSSPMPDVIRVRIETVTMAIRFSDSSASRSSTYGLVADLSGSR